MLYIRRKGKDTWHWLCPVTKRPRNSDIKMQVRGRPQGGELCDLCRSLERKAKAK